MRRFPSALLFFSALLLLAIAATAASSGQADSSAPVPTLRTGANLVLVDVIVTDRGKPVLGIAPSRFHIFDNGKQQTVSSFDEHQPGAPVPVVQPTLPPDTYSNAPEYPQASVVNVLLLDALNTPIANQMQVRHQMIEYLASVKPGTQLAIFTLGMKLRMVTEFTNNPAALLALLKKPKTSPRQSPLINTPDTPAPASSEMTSVTPPTTAAAAIANLSKAEDFIAGPMDAAQALDQFESDTSAFQTDFRIRLTLDAMKQLASYLGGIPGRKNVIWFSGSFPLAILPDSSLFDPFRNTNNYVRQIRQATDMLTSARVAIYPVDARGLWVGPQFSAEAGFVSSGAAQSAAFSSESEERFSEESAMQQIAGDTGGKAFVETNDLGKALVDAIENGSSYYTLAYAPQKGAFDGKFHKIEVRLDDGKGLKLAYRRGYYADGFGSGAAGNKEAAGVFAAALAHNAPGATAVRFKARVLPASDPAFQNVSLPIAFSGNKAAFKGPAHRYIVDLTLDPAGLTYDIAPNGVRNAAIELALIAYDDGSGQMLNQWTHSYSLGLDPAKLEHILKSGITLRLPFDVPAGKVDLRIGVYDFKGGRAGSLEVPLDVAKP